MKSILWYFSPSMALKIFIKFYTEHNYKPKSMRELQILFVDYGHAWGVLPFYYDTSTDTFVLHETKSALFCWVLVIGSYFFICLILGVNLILKFKTQNLVITNISDIMLVFNAACCWSGGLLHLHTAYKRRDIVDLLNLYYSHTKYLNRMSLSEPSNPVGRYLIYFLLSMIIMPVLDTLLYMGSCEFHYLAAVLPICSRAGLNTTPPWFAHVALILFQLIYVNQIIACAYIYATVGLMVMFDGLGMIRTLIIPRDRQLSLRACKTWIFQYRSSQILSKEVNNAIGQVFLPVHMFAILSVTILASYLLIKHNFGLLFTVSLIAFDVVMAYFMFTWGNAAAFKQLSKEALDSVLNQSNNLYQRKLFQSCPLITVRIGSFAQLDKRILIRTYLVVVDFVISLLIVTFQSKDSDPGTKMHRTFVTLHTASLLT